MPRRLARRQRARAARPQQRPLVDRGRCHEPVRAAPPGDLRAAARLGRDARAGVAMVNLLGEGAPRPAHPTGIYAALDDPTSTSTCTTSARVFERRKMGHVTALGATSTRRWPGRARPRAHRLGRPRRRGRRDDRAAPRTRRRSSGSSAAAARTSRCWSRPSRVLDELGVPSELRVVSAHRTPGPAVPIRGGGGGPGHPGDHRRRRRRRPPARACSPPRRPCRSSACRCRPSTSTAWIRCSRSSRCRAASPSRRSRSATATNAGLLAAEILALGDPALADATGRLAGPPDPGGPRRPVERGDLSAAPAERPTRSRGRPWPARGDGARAGAGRGRARS